MNKMKKKKVKKIKGWAVKVYWSFGKKYDYNFTEHKAYANFVGGEFKPAVLIINEDSND